MKLTRTSLMMLLSGILIIAFAGLGMAYSRQSSAQSQLNQELAQAQLIFNKASSDEILPQRDELEKRLAEGQSRLQILKTNLSPELQSIESSDDLFITAEKVGVEVVVTRSTPPSAENLNGIDYSTLEFRVTLEGEVADIIRFIHIWTEEHPTGLVKSVRINVPEAIEEETSGEDEAAAGDEEDEGAIEDEAAAGDEDEGDIEDEAAAGDEDEEEETGQTKPSADIELIIYTYRGS